MNPRFILFQSSTMPVLSLHNTYSLPSGSASYSLGLSGVPSHTYPSSGGVLGTSAGLCGTTSGLANLSLTSTLPNLGYTSSSYSTYTNPLLSGAMNMKLKPLDDIDLGLGRYSTSATRGDRSGTPLSPIPSNSWGLDSYSGLEAVNPTFMHSQRPLSRLGGLDLDGE